MSNYIKYFTIQSKTQSLTWRIQSRFRTQLRTKEYSMEKIKNGDIRLCWSGGCLFTSLCVSQQFVKCVFLVGKKHKIIECLIWKGPPRIMESNSWMSKINFKERFKGEATGMSEREQNTSWICKNNQRLLLQKNQLGRKFRSSLL